MGPQVCALPTLEIPRGLLAFIRGLLCVAWLFIHLCFVFAFCLCLFIDFSVDPADKIQRRIINQPRNKDCSPDRWTRIDYYLLGKLLFLEIPKIMFSEHLMMFSKWPPKPNHDAVELWIELLCRAPVSKSRILSSATKSN